MRIANQTWPGSLCVARDCRAAIPFIPALRNYFLAIAYPTPCKCGGAAAGGRGVGQHWYCRVGRCCSGTGAPGRWLHGSPARPPPALRPRRDHVPQRPLDHGPQHPPADRAHPPARHPALSERPGLRGRAPLPPPPCRTAASRAALHLPHPPPTIRHPTIPPPRQGPWVSSLFVRPNSQSGSQSVATGAGHPGEGRQVWTETPQSAVPAGYLVQADPAAGVYLCP